MAWEHRFEELPVVDVGGAKRRACQVRCSRCDASARIIATHRHLPAEAVASRFRRQGWSIHDRNPARDVCPACARTPRPNATERKPEMAPAPTSPPPSPPKDRLTLTKAGVPVPPAPSRPSSAEPPVPLGVDDRRIIFAKLTDVYVTPATGYAPGWTDQRVADDLGVPRDWIRQVRDDFFGPAVGDATAGELRAALEETKELQNSLASASAKALDAATEAFTALSNCRALAEKARVAANKADDERVRITKRVGELFAKYLPGVLP